MLRYEDELEKLKLENTALSDTLTKNAQQLLRHDEQLQSQQLELTIAQEKHRTCQQEVRVTGCSAPACHYLLAGVSLGTLQLHCKCTLTYNYASVFLVPPGK